MRTVGTALILLAVSLPAVVSSQTAFDVASIKENAMLGVAPSGPSLITVARQLQPYQLLGAPDGVRSAFYDIKANPAEKATCDWRPADDATTIFTALQQQPGLKLERRRVSAKYLLSIISRSRWPTKV